MPETFGNNGSFSAKFAQSYDHLEMSLNKKATLIEKLAEQAWNRVTSGKKPTPTANSKRK